MRSGTHGPHSGRSIPSLCVLNRSSVLSGPHGPIPSQTPCPALCPASGPCPSRPRTPGSQPRRCPSPLPGNGFLDTVPLIPCCLTCPPCSPARKIGSGRGLIAPPRPWLVVSESTAPNTVSGQWLTNACCWCFWWENYIVWVNLSKSVHFCKKLVKIL